MGQLALLQKLEDLLSVVKGEAHLIAMGLKKYVTEKQVIDFYEKVGEDKNLKLTWIMNFGRIIPDEIYEAKKLADERKIFDNYVILHYDPENNGEKLTKEEVEKKKDPILFGVIKDSRKLYYIADWKDEYCELTLEEMFKELGEKVLNINNKSVKTFIDKTIA
jgi:RNA recognition motif-containing protein